ncbi:MAG: Gfo/Idh/MocA family oxidoreductase [Pseudomonadota bacterium]
MTRSSPKCAALIGTGMVADMHVAAALATKGAVEITGAFSRTPAHTDAFAKRHTIGAYPSVDAALEDPKVDFVILTTPPDARLEYVHRCIEARRPILMEKPIERDHARARIIVEACETAALPLGVLLQHRMRPAAQELQRHLSAGAIGDIAVVDVRIPWWRDQSYYDVPGRGTYARDGGGVLITQAIHTIDLMLQFCGPVSEVQGFAVTSALHRMEAEDLAAVGLRFASGAVGVLTASTAHYPGGSETIFLSGTAGSATLTSNQLKIERHGMAPEDFGSTTGTGGGADPMAFSADWHRAVIEDFADALRSGRAPLISARSALPAQSLIDAILTSARTGAPAQPEASE